MFDTVKQRSDPTEEPGRKLAVVAESWFLVNLMLLPFLGFLAIVYLYVRHHDTSPILARNHLRQTVGVGIAGGCLLVGVISAFVLLAGIDSGYALMAVVLYFTCVHTGLILCGAIGLSKALSGKSVCYPLIGRWFLSVEERQWRRNEL